jgi:hypothetical protein
MEKSDVSYWPCYCAFWGSQCATCKLRLSLDPTGEQIKAIPYKVKPVVKQKRLARRARPAESELLYTGDRVVLIDPATNKVVGE